jgi:hypothetical protein
LHHRGPALLDSCKQTQQHIEEFFVTTKKKNAPALRGPITVYSLAQWCEMRGLSMATARRLNADGKLKFTKLSERRIGIRSDHDQEYLDACEVGS